MGAVSAHRPKGISNDAFFLTEVIGPGRSILASATIAGTYYAAVREQASGEVWALIVPVQWTRGWLNFTYKAMDETEGPIEDEAPAKVLDGLTRTVDEWTNEWRERCRANLAKKAARPTVRPGALVRFAQPLLFADGQSADTFALVARSTFTRGGQRYRIPRWRRYDYQLVEV